MKEASITCLLFLLLVLTNCGKDSDPKPESIFANVDEIILNSVGNSTYSNYDISYRFQYNTSSELSRINRINNGGDNDYETAYFVFDQEELQKLTYEYTAPQEPGEAPTTRSLEITYNYQEGNLISFESEYEGEVDLTAVEENSNEVIVTSEANDGFDDYTYINHYKFKEGSLEKLEAWGENETSIRDEDKYIYTTVEHKNFYELNWVIDGIIYEAILKWRFSENLYERIVRHETLAGNDEVEAFEFSYTVINERITGVTIERFEGEERSTINIEIKYN